MDLNDDVLGYIMMEVLLQSRRPPHNPDLLSASLVCHRWTAPAQAALYHAVSLSIGFHRTEDERATCFRRTMQTCPHLLRLIRHLTVKSERSLRKTPLPPSEILSWVNCIPQDTLLSFAFHPRLRDDLPSIVSCQSQPEDVLIRAPAVRTVRRLTLDKCCHHADTLLSIATFPQLEEFSIRFAECSKFEHFDDTIIEPGMPVSAAFPKLRVAGLSSALVHGSPSTSKFLSLAIRAPQLQILELRYLSSQFYDELIVAFRSMTPTLKVFSITMIAVDLILASPFMDEVVARLTSLNTLAITGGMFSAALLQRLPRTLISLYIHSPPHCLRPGSGEAALEYITHAIRMRDPLKTITLKQWGLSNDLCTRISNACLEGGIECKLDDSRLA